ncbi:MAG: NAD-dependent epimerase/dehydratase family protein [Pseudomonadota bacterium]|nr:NAD-dependent epimerase/dehydratase family protein [Pseudomonadota bacterium]
MKVLVLGSTGFIGKNLIDSLQSYTTWDGSESHSFPAFPDSISIQGNQLILSGASLSTGVDLRNYQQTYDCINNFKPELIYNLASHGGSLHYVKEKAADVIADNIQMTLNVYKAINESRQNCKVIQPFSNCSYPGDSSIQREEKWLSGDVHESIFSFGNSKRTIFYISKCYQMQYGINTVNLLLPNTYGPGDSIDPNHTHALNGMVIRMLQAKKAGDSEFVVWGTGSPVREWCYVDDFIKALIEANKLESAIEPINIGQNKGYSIAESAALIQEACEYTGDIVFDTSYPDGAPVKRLSGEVTKSTFPDFKFYDHKQGIANTVKYYEDKL